MIDRARAVADAVLYEGFLLFPYAKSALKNHMPFQFGVLMPQGYADPSEPPQGHCEAVLCDVRDGARIDGVLRFLQADPDPEEREVPFEFRVDGESSPVAFTMGRLRGEISLSVTAEGSLFRLAVDVRNLTPASAPASRNAALPGALISVNLLLQAQGARFVSMLDPPAQAKDAALRSRNDRFFPVLAGAEDGDVHTSDVLLISPIILYDFPRIAPHSQTRTFDGTEVDELLMLSVASLTDEEKREARSAHPFVRELVERAEALDADTQQLLHGELTGGSGKPGDERVIVSGTTIGPGSHVRVHPKRRADVWDDIVRGMSARVKAVHTDFDGNRYVGVVFDADPASGEHEWYGRSFFYGADEIEPIA